METGADQLAWFPFHRLGSVQDCEYLFFERLPCGCSYLERLNWTERSFSLLSCDGARRGTESHSNNNLAYLRLWINDTTTQFLGLSRDLIRVYVLGGYYLRLRPLRALF